MEDRGAKAEAFFRQGYNCSQSVALAFADLLPLDEKTLAKLASGFGGGFSRLREVCGGLSGAVLVLDLLFGYDGPETGAPKRELYARVQEVAHRLEAENGSYVCRELLGRKNRDTPDAEARTAAYYEKRPCPAIVARSAFVLQGYLRENGIEA